METIFKNTQGGSPRFIEDGEDYAIRVRALIDDATDFEESYLAPERESNQRYYQGLEPSLNQPDEGEEDEPVNRSTFVSTDVRDTILTVMPSLIRIFTSDANSIAEFVPNTEEQQGMADQCRDYINYVFNEDNEGVLILHTVFKDALTVKAGITKWWTDVEHEVTEQTFRNITMEQFQYLITENPTAEVVGQGPVGDQLIDGVPSQVVSSVTLRFVKVKPIHRVEAVPPDEFRIARDARSIETAGLVGHHRVVPVSELIKKGFTPEELEELGVTVTTQVSYSDERFLRNPGLADDRAIEGVMYGEWYIRIDGDGDGVDELRYICTVGGEHTIVHDEVVPYTRFALWCPDPRPHTAIGDCLADITKDVQRIKTNMMRGQLDNLAESIHPRTVVNEMVTNVEDVLSDEVGAVIRTRGDVGGAVMFTRTPYAGADVQMSVDYLDKVRASRTGITEASKGLDPKAMQSTALVGIDAIVSGAQERIELIARLLAETGYKATIKGLLREVVDNPCPERVIKLRGKWVPVNPSTFDPSMRVKINPTLGKGTDMVRAQALAKVEQTQLMIIQRFGINNPIVTPEEFRNCIVDQLEIANIKNVGRYFREITPEIMEAMAAKPQEPSPEQLLAQAELEKVKKDVIIATGKAELDHKRLDLDTRRVDIQASKVAMDDDFRRDKLDIEASIEAAKLTTGFSVNDAVNNANDRDNGYEQ